MRCKKIIFGTALMASAILSLGAGEPLDVNKPQVETVYVVQSGDTLRMIADRHMVLNTYGPRDIREFMEGIIELNYESVFKGRQRGEIHAGDELRINYWVADRT